MAGIVKPITDPGRTERQARVARALASVRLEGLEPAAPAALESAPNYVKPGVNNPSSGANCTRDSLEQPDLLLIQVAKARPVPADGIHLDRLLTHMQRILEINSLQPCPKPSWRPRVRAWSSGRPRTVPHYAIRPVSNSFIG
jgi:hypothetical protein